MLLASLKGYAQSYLGIWHGFITAETLLNPSQLALNVKSHEGNIITGKAYLYNNFLYVFYGAFDFIGTIDQNNCKLTELRLNNSEMPDEIRTLCIKYSNLTYSKNDTAEFLTGSWGNSKGNCLPGDVYLERGIAGKPATRYIPAAVIAKIKSDSSPDVPFLNTVLSKPVIVNIGSNQLTISINDYLREDGDTVSVYVNRELFISKMEIRRKVFSKKIRLDKISGLNEIVMYANNLGSIPPNTCILTVDDGIRKQRIAIQSSMEKSAAIYLRYVRPN